MILINLYIYRWQFFFISSTIVWPLEFSYMHVSYEIRLIIKISVDFLTGHYIYIEASSPRKPGDNAMLVSAQQPTPTSDQCFEFWYSMYGVETGTLNLYIEHGNQLGSPVWTKQGELKFIFFFCTTFSIFRYTTTYNFVYLNPIVSILCYFRI